MNEFPLDRGICELLTQVPLEQTEGARSLLALYQEDALEMTFFGEETIQACRDLLRRRLLCLLGSGAAWETSGRREPSPMRK
jgi:hypothetical protein